MDDEQEQSRVDWWRELLAVGLCGLVPAVVVGLPVYEQVKHYAFWARFSLPHGLGTRLATKQPWVLEAERYMLLSVETSAALTAASLVFIAVALLRAWRRGRVRAG